MASSLGAGRHSILDDLDPRGGERLILPLLQQAEAGEAVDDDGLVAIWQLKELQDHADGAGGLQIGDLRIFGVGVALGYKRR